MLVIHENVNLLQKKCKNVVMIYMKNTKTLKSLNLSMLSRTFRIISLCVNFFKK
jgi:hypothetical protein